MMLTEVVEESRESPVLSKNVVNAVNLEVKFIYIRHSLQWSKIEYLQLRKLNLRNNLHHILLTSHFT